MIRKAFCLKHGYYWSTGQRCPDWTQTVKYQHSFDPIMVTCKTPSVPALDPMEDFRRFSGQSPGSIYSPPRVVGGLILLPSLLGMPAKWGTDCLHQCLSDLCHCHPWRIRNTCSDIKCDFILGDNCWFFKSLVRRMIVWDPLWGFNPTFMRLKIQWFPYSTVIFCSFLATENITECIPFRLFQLV